MLNLLIQLAPLGAAAFYLVTGYITEGVMFMILTVCIRAVLMIEHIHLGINLLLRTQAVTLQMKLLEELGVDKPEDSQ